MGDYIKLSYQRTPDSEVLDALCCEIREYQAFWKQGGTANDNGGNMDAWYESHPDAVGRNWEEE